jgi:hypothetical protein
MDEINRIVDRHNTPTWIPSLKHDRHTFGNYFRAGLSDMMKNGHSSEQRDSKANVAISSNQENEKTSSALLPVKEGESAKQSSATLHPGSSGEKGWVEEDGWRVKYDMYGNVVDLYRHYQNV